jgi:hypothetical protein
MDETSIIEYFYQNKRYPFSAVFEFFKEKPEFLLTSLVEIIVEGSILRQKDMSYYYERIGKLHTIIKTESI